MKLQNKCLARCKFFSLGFAIEKCRFLKTNIPLAFLFRSAVRWVLNNFCVMLLPMLEATPCLASERLMWNSVPQKRRIQENVAFAPCLEASERPMWNSVPQRRRIQDNVAFAPCLRWSRIGLGLGQDWTRDVQGLD